jgi:hypothetical protein
MSPGGLYANDGHLQADPHVPIWSYRAATRWMRHEPHPNEPQCSAEVTTISLRLSGTCGAGKFPRCITRFTKGEIVPVFASCEINCHGNDVTGVEHFQRGDAPLRRAGGSSAGSRRSSPKLFMGVSSRAKTCDLYGRMSGGAVSHLRNASVIFMILQTFMALHEI